MIDPVQDGQGSGAVKLGSNVDAAAVVAGLRDLVVVIDDQLQLVWCNAAITLMLGWTPDQVLYRSIADLLHPDDIAVALVGIDHLHNGNEIYRVGVRLLSASGDWIAVSVTGLDQTAHPGVRGLVLSTRMAEQHTKDLGDLQRQTSTDRLTGLPNRRSLRDLLRAMVKLDDSNTSADACVTACLIDLDRFKNFNDIHGHRVGDEILAETARRVRQHTATGDILARNGGDELYSSSLAKIVRGTLAMWSKAIRASLAQPFEIEENVLHLSASVGVASQRFDSLDSDLLLQQADLALYAAKERGRDTVVAFDETLAVAARHTQRQRMMVREALESDRLKLQFQPIVNADLEIVGVEALARCVHVDGSFIEPNDFLPSVAGTSLAVQLDHDAFTQSCHAAVSFEQRAGASNALWVGCNVAPGTLAQGDFAERILATIKATGANPNQICVEITETAAFEAGPSSLTALERLADAGVQIALDDFGTGFSCLSHLLNLPISKIKIDQSFVDRVHEGGPEHAITRGATDLAHSLRYEVVAEGVETQAQLDAVQSLGVELMQGWHFAPAMCFDSLIEFLDNPQLRTDPQASSCIDV